MSLQKWLMASAAPVVLALAGCSSTPGMTPLGVPKPGEVVIINSPSEGHFEDDLKVVARVRPDGGVDVLYGVAGPGAGKVVLGTVAPAAVLGVSSVATAHVQGEALKDAAGNYQPDQTNVTGVAGGISNTQEQGQGQRMEQGQGQQQGNKWVNNGRERRPHKPRRGHGGNDDDDGRPGGGGKPPPPPPPPPAPSTPPPHS